ncbi:MAG: septum formation initiator family protein [Clostridiales Family XIII bacterium]|nr:septum formation initiator family protein [Clostridiales Family XIII bacterium]
MGKKKEKKIEIIDLGEARNARRQKRDALAKKKAEHRENQLVRKNKARLFGRLYAVIAVLFVVFAVMFAVRIAALQTDLVNATSENDMVLEKKARLENELEHIGDPEYLEQQARARLHMIKPGEILYVLPESGSNGDSNSEESNDTDADPTVDEGA